MSNRSTDGPEQPTDSFHYTQGLPDLADPSERLDRLAKIIVDEGLLGLLVTNLVNIRYLTGFTGSAAMLFVDSENRHTVLVTDGRYDTQATEQLGNFGVAANVEIGSLSEQYSALKHCATSANAASGKKIGLEAQNIPLSQHQKLSNGVFSDFELIATSDLVESIRLVKDTGEISLMEQAAGIADQSLGLVIESLATRVKSPQGVSEKEVALELDFEMRRRGATASAFETIVASGPNAAKPHHRPSDRKIGPGESIVIDFGALFEGYRSDMTRTFCVGAPLDPTLSKMIEVVTAAQSAGVAAVGAGCPASAVDLACRQVIAEAGWADRFLHGTGHGVGLDIHEAPWIGATTDEPLRAGSVVTVEPGVYIPELGGVRVEDTVVVTDAGCRALTCFGKDPIIG